jgi:hypothetical protein
MFGKKLADQNRRESRGKKTEMSLSKNIDAVTYKYTLSSFIKTELNTKKENATADISVGVRVYIKNNYSKHQVKGDIMIKGVEVTNFL